MADGSNVSVLKPRALWSREAAIAEAFARIEAEAPDTSMWKPRGYDGLGASIAATSAHKARWEGR